MEALDLPRSMVSGISGIGNVTDDYSHDPLDQLVCARYALSGGTPVRDVQYSFDAVGNRTAVDDSGTNTSYTVNSMNQYTAIGGGSLTYDNNGNLATGAGLTLGYDAQGRLVSAATATNAVSFIYDGCNRCVARTTVTATSGSTVWFVWGHEQSSHWGLLEERDADGDLVARYVHGEGIDEILRREAGASTVFYHHDALGSTIALTDGSGALVEQYRYDVYGLPTILDASGADLGSRTSALGNRFMFTGREWLSDLALYDYRHRAYSPHLGRWLQPDPIGFGAGDVNWYRYCGGGPAGFIDPMGLLTMDDLKALPAEIKQVMKQALQDTINDPQRRERAGGVYKGEKSGRYKNFPATAPYISPPSRTNQDGSTVYGWPDRGPPFYSSLEEMDTGWLNYFRKYFQWHTHPDVDRDKPEPPSGVDLSPPRSHPEVVISKEMIYIVEDGKVTASASTGFVLKAGKVTGSASTGCVLK
ncbi:MAG: hypothetical protein KJ579_11270 [Verrucomicrobia bacterium]|nr:hypothetical protein [Verrucomicrobiota bacterium]